MVTNIAALCFSPLFWLFFCRKLLSIFLVGPKVFFTDGKLCVPRAINVGPSQRWGKGGRNNHCRCWRGQRRRMKVYTEIVRKAVRHAQFLNYSSASIQIWRKTSINLNSWNIWLSIHFTFCCLSGLFGLFLLCQKSCLLFYHLLGFFGMNMTKPKHLCIKPERIDFLLWFASKYAQISIELVFIIKE